MKDLFHNASWRGCDGETKSFMQLRPWYDGLEKLYKIEYCTKCGGYEEQEYEGDGEEE